MIISTAASVRIGSTNMKYYKSIGYVDIKINDIINVSISKLPVTTNTTVSAICDFCSTIVIKPYCHYIQSISVGGGFACSRACGQIKLKKHIIEKYGVENVFQVKNFKESIKQTLMTKYGVDNPMKSPAIKEKSKNTNLSCYGTVSTFQNEEVRQKYKENFLKNHGVENPFSSQEVKEQIKKTNK